MASILRVARDFFDIIGERQRRPKVDPAVPQQQVEPSDAASPPGIAELILGLAGVIFVIVTREQTACQSQWRPN